LITTAHARTALVALSLILAAIAFAVSAQDTADATARGDSTQSLELLYQEQLAALRTHDGVRSDLVQGQHPGWAVFNREAPIPPQCYTRIEGRFNPCYVCHQNAVAGRENSMNDGGQQLAYNFSDVGLTNHWKNLFEDRSEAVAAISDAEILDWIDDDNYSALAGRLRAVDFQGWIPDLANLQLGAAAFDEYGFARDGSHWVAFNYKPLPSTFWPTNGSTDDVMIRLAEPFRSDADGNYSRDVYRANLAIVEAQVKDLPRITSLPVDERKLGIDLDGDGELSVVQEISAVDGYVGAAAGSQSDTFLYPKGTEFLHTVRYVGVDGQGQVGVSTRMKEVRYMKKWRWYPKMSYGREYDNENMNKERGHLPGYHYVQDYGLDNGFGWSIQGFIEGFDGQLRVASFEENLFCMGCHTSIGATIDKTFSFPRKVDGAAGWGYIDLRGMPDAPNRGERRGEIATYLERVGGGGEFRSNQEMFARWYREDGSVNHDKVAAAADVYELITPSRERALQLNKAYRVIVAEQDYAYGRDATVTPPVNVYDKVDVESAPTLPPEKFFPWDIRLDWSAAGAGSVVATN
tara:strand:+ start:49 stop:1776 length:1728 start_codon:yes stop_codon:yes gene_type:complete